MPSPRFPQPTQMMNKLKHLKILFVTCIWMLVVLVLLLTYTARDTSYRSQTWSTTAEQFLMANNDNDVTKNRDEQLWLDAITEPVDANYARLQQLELPNVPFEYIFRQRLQRGSSNLKCARAPSVSSLQFHNNYWQTFRNANVTFQLFGAYYDARRHVNEGRVVRLLAMASQLETPPNTSMPASYCQLWFENRSEPAIVPVTKYRAIWHKKWGSGGAGDLYPHLISCTVPPELNAAVPQAVSLVERECHEQPATNSLRVIYEPPPAGSARGGFAVCVKGLEFPFEDLSARLVEWLELLRLLGARKVVAYELAVHPNMGKVLRHYEAQRFVELRPLTLANEVPMTPLFTHSQLHANVRTKRLNEVIPYNDCFYRHMLQYDYIALLDLDEVIMPLGSRRHWFDLIAAAEAVRLQSPAKCAQGYAGVCVRNIHFPINAENFTGSTDAPSYMFMLQHVRRQPEHSPPGAAVKCLHNTSEALTLHNHFSLERLSGCAPLQLQPDVAQLQHYSRLKQPGKWTEPVIDRSIYRYKEALMASVAPVLRELGFLRSA